MGAIVLAIFFAPSVIAFWRGDRDRIAVLLANVMLWVIEWALSTRLGLSVLTASARDLDRTLGSFTAVGYLVFGASALVWVMLLLWALFGRYRRLA